jgi:hypothetical protein
MKRDRRDGGLTSIACLAAILKFRRDRPFVAW